MADHELEVVMKGDESLEGAEAMSMAWGEAIPNPALGLQFLVLLLYHPI